MHSTMRYNFDHNLAYLLPVTTTQLVLGCRPIPEQKLPYLALKKYQFNYCGMDQYRNKASNLRP